MENSCMRRMDKIHSMIMPIQNQIVFISGNLKIEKIWECMGIHHINDIRIRLPFDQYTLPYVHSLNLARAIHMCHLRFASYRVAK